MEPILTLGPLSVTPYSLMMLCGAAAGILIAARNRRIRPALPGMVICALVFAHLFWALFNMEETETPLMQFVQFWRGGYTLYGAVFGALLAAWVAAGRLKVRLAEITDAAAPGAAAAILLGRLGEYFSGAGYGSIVEEGSPCFFPLAYITYQEEEYIEWSYAVWAWEAAAALVMLCVLLHVGRRARQGEATAVFLTLLGTTQILLEQFRQDDYVVTFNSFVRFSQVAAVVTLVILLLLLIRCHHPGALRAGLSALTFVLAALTVVFAEFAFDKPAFDLWMRLGIGLSAVSAAAMLRAFRGWEGILPGGVLLLLAAILLLLHCLGKWESEVLLLYMITASSVSVMGITLYMNMDRDHPEEACL